MIRKLFCHSALVANAFGLMSAMNPLIADDPLPPDVVVLSSGGRLEGQVSEQKVGNRTIVEVKRSDGSIIQLTKDQVKFVRRPKVAHTEYVAKKFTMEDTIDAHWEMSQWCRDNLDSRLSNGTSELGPERRFHLQAILKLDPDHKDARHLLDYTKEKGAWINLEQKRLGHGFVRYNKRWMTREEVALEKAEEAWKDQQANWARRLKKLRSSSGRDAELIVEFSKIDDAAAIKPLIELLDSEKSEQWQLVYVDALGNIRSAQAARALCDIAVTHASPVVREHCIARLKLEHVDQRAAAQYLAGRYLNSKENELINRAGFIIGELGAGSAIGLLIDALVTEHIIPNPLAANPGALTTTFSNQGNGISSGNSQPKLLKHTARNHSVLDALRLLTKADFGFEEQSWKDWFAQQHTLIDVDASRDE